MSYFFFGPTPPAGRAGLPSGLLPGACLCVRWNPLAACFFSFFFSAGMPGDGVKKGFGAGLCWAKAGVSGRACLMLGVEFLLSGLVLLKLGVDFLLDDALCLLLLLESTSP